MCLSSLCAGRRCLPASACATSHLGHSTQLRKLAGAEDAPEDGGAAPDAEGSDPDAAAAEPAEAAAPAQAKESLLTAAAKARKERPAETDAEKILKEEQDMLRAITQRTALKSVKELAKARPYYPWNPLFYWLLCCRLPCPGPSRTETYMSLVWVKSDGHASCSVLV